MPLTELPWPHTLPTPSVTSASVMGIPGVGRAVALLAGLIRQMPIDAVRGPDILPRPAFFEKPQPDPGLTRSWFVGVQVEDYLIHGNAIHIITARSTGGRPLAAQYLPASWVTCTWHPTHRLQYWSRGVELNRDDVVHVRRGADRTMPWRGVGVVEQHLRAFNRMDTQERYETNALGSGVPSVVIETPNPDLSQEDADDAADRWVEKYRERKPAILPKGTVVTPLAWSPNDAQMVEARKLSLQDTANIFNLDGIWTGAPASGLTYKNLAALYLSLLTQTVDPIVEDFAGAWSEAWTPERLRGVRFDRADLLHSDMETDIGWLDKAVTRGLFTGDEAREWLGKAPIRKAQP